MDIPLLDVFSALMTDLPLLFCLSVKDSTRLTHSQVGEAGGKCQSESASSFTCTDRRTGGKNSHERGRTKPERQRPESLLKREDSLEKRGKVTTCFLLKIDSKTVGVPINKIL